MAPACHDGSSPVVQFIEGTKKSGGKDEDYVIGRITSPRTIATGSDRRQARNIRRTRWEEEGISRSETLKEKGKKESPGRIDFVEKKLFC